MAGGSYSSLTPPASGQVIQRQWGLDVRDSVITVHASSAARTSAIATPTEGMVTYLSDTDTLWVYRSSVWRPLRNAPDFYRCHLSQTAGTSIGSSGVFTPVLWDTELSDPSGWHSTSSNTSRITPTVAGTLLVAYTINTGTTGSWVTACIRKNGGTTVEYAESQTPGPVGGQWGLNGLARVDVNGSTDYVELYCAQGTVGSVTTDVNRTFFICWMESWS